MACTPPDCTRSSTPPRYVFPAMSTVLPALGGRYRVAFPASWPFRVSFAPGPTPTVQEDRLAGVLPAPELTLMVTRGAATISTRTFRACAWASAASARPQEKKRNVRETRMSSPSIRIHSVWRLTGT